MEDIRNILIGREIPTEGYCDQPNLIEINDTTWLCLITTGAGKEGENNQHVISMRSHDKGQTWVDKRDVESIDEPDTSYSVLFQNSFGRIYCFYCLRDASVEFVSADPGVYENDRCYRVDTIGDFVFKYSDDEGLSWSSERFLIPIRPFKLDLENAHEGKIKYGWNVSSPCFKDDLLIIPFNKVGKYGEGLYSLSEGSFLASRNINSEKDPGKIKWDTLPEGEIGIQSPVGGGPIAEEHSCVFLNDGSLYDIFRTVDGYAAYTQSRDNGLTWSPSQYATYRNGDLIKQPRAANFIFKCKNNKYLYWFHFNSWNGYNFGEGSGSRNIAWLCGGIEEDGTIKWSQPEIILYHPDFYQGPSYPCLLESDGEYYLGETVKNNAYVHQLDKGQLERLWSQHESSSPSQEGLVVNWHEDRKSSLGLPDFTPFTLRDYWSGLEAPQNLNTGLTIEMGFVISQYEVGAVVLSNQQKRGKGFSLKISDSNNLLFTLSDGRTENSWSLDVDSIKLNYHHHLSIIVDGASRTIIFVLDGRVLDGGKDRYYGYARFSLSLGDVNGTEKLQINKNGFSDIDVVKVYSRSLSVSETISSYLLTQLALIN